MLDCFNTRVRVSVKAQARRAARAQTPMPIDNILHVPILIFLMISKALLPSILNRSLNMASTAVECAAKLGHILFLEQARNFFQCYSLQIKLRSGSLANRHCGILPY